MKEVLNVFKALADETRLRILKLLEGGELCVCDITAALDMTQPNISFHLAALRDAGLISDRKEGRWSYYQLNVSDIMSRVVLATALERIGPGSVAPDRARLAAFLERKRQGACKV